MTWKGTQENKMLTHNIHVKMGSYGIPPVLHAVEGETGRFINIYTDDRAVTSSEEAELSIHRPDDSYYTDDHATVMPDSGEVQGFYHFSLVQALTRSGKVDCQLKISKNGLVLSTYTFCIIVEPSTTGLPVEQLGYDIYDLIAAAETLRGTGLTDDIKSALLDCFEHVAWTDEHGQDYVDALEAALYPPAELVSISAVYTQSGTVYTTDSLDDLKSDLVVTAVYSDSTTQTVTNYTLSGALSVGTSTVTVSYGGKTTTFSVNVTHDTRLPLLYNWDFTQSLMDSVGGTFATLSHYNQTDPTRDSNGLSFTESGQCCDLGAIFAVNRIFEIDFAGCSLPTSTGNHVRSFMVGNTDETTNGVVLFRDTRWTVYNNAWWSGSYSVPSDSLYTYFANKTVKLAVDADGYIEMFVDDVSLGKSGGTGFTGNNLHLYLGNKDSAGAGGNFYNVTITGVRVYNAGT